jgi:hypothetical protein
MARILSAMAVGPAWLLQGRVMWRLGASASSHARAKLTPSTGDWVTARMLVGGSLPRASRTVGTMSMAWPYWVRTSPLDSMPLGHLTTKWSLMPPRKVSRFQGRKGVLPARVHPRGK